MTHTPSMSGTQKEVTYSHGYKKKEVVKLRGVYIVGVCTTEGWKAQASVQRFYM